MRSFLPAWQRRLAACALAWLAWTAGPQPVRSQSAPSFSITWGNAEWTRRLEDPDPGVRIAALRYFARSPVRDNVYAAASARLERETDPAVAAFALSLLVENGRPLDEGRIRAVASGMRTAALTPWVAAAALHALGTLATRRPLEAASLQLLAEFRATRGSAPDAALVDALVQLPPEQFADVLGRHRSRRGSPDARLIEAIAARAEGSAAEMIRDGLASSSVEVVVSSCEALARWRTESAVPTLVHVLRTAHDPRVRLAAYTAVARIVTIVPDDVLQSALDDPFVRRTALQGLREESDPGQASLVTPLLTAAWSMDRVAALEASVRLRGLAALPSLARAIGDADVSVRFAARRALARLGPRAVADLVPSFADPLDGWAWLESIRLHESADVPLPDPEALRRAALAGSAGARVLALTAYPSVQAPVAGSGTEDPFAAQETYLALALGLSLARTPRPLPLAGETFVRVAAIDAESAAGSSTTADLDAWLRTRRDAEDSLDAFARVLAGARLGLRSASAAAVPWLSRAEPALRIAAARVLTLRPMRSAAHPLERALLVEGDPRVRTALAEALLACGANDARALVAQLAAVSFTREMQVALVGALGRGATALAPVTASSRPCVALFPGNRPGACGLVMAEGALPVAACAARDGVVWSACPGDGPVSFVVLDAPTAFRPRS